MKYRSFSLSLSLALWLAVNAHSEPLQTSPLSIEAIAQQPLITSVTLSPDGRHIAAIIASPQYKWPVMAIWQADNPSSAPFLIPSWNTRPVSIEFLGDRWLMFEVDNPYGANRFAERWIRTVVTDLKGSSFKYPFKSLKGLASLIAVLQTGNFEDPNRYLFNSTYGTYNQISVYALDVETLQLEKYRRGARNFVQGTLDAYLVADVRDGQLMVRENIRSTSAGWWVYREIRNRRTDAWEEHPQLGYPIKDRRISVPLGFFDPDPNKLFVATNLRSDMASIWVYDIIARTWEAEPAFASSQTDILDASASLDWNAKKVLGVGSYTVRDSAHRKVFLDDKWSAVQQAVEVRFPGHNVVFLDRDRKSGRALIAVSSPKQPPLYYLWRNNRELSLLGKSRPWIDASALGDTSRRAYKSRDGLNIPAFVTLPPGYDKAEHGRLPLVVLPHGGPWARDDLDWDPNGWTQFLATRGYAVAQPQFRGSKGWGVALWKAGDKEWGQKMQDDNDDAARWLIADGIADPSRIAILGYSYGGYAAMAATVRPNNLYRCAISGAGISDLSRAKAVVADDRIQRDLQGWTVEGLDPLRNVEAVSIPIMLFHGTNDTVVPIRHSRDFFNALRRAGKNVEYHEISKMWHQLPWWPEWHRETLGLIESYLAGPKCFGAK